MSRPLPPFSVVVTTYNQPDTLALVLAALARQVPLPAEVIVADDGSTPATRAMLAGEAPGYPCPLVHTWQPDRGFRVARARNNAIAAATQPAVACLDQDILPFAGWLAVYAAAVRPGRVCLGDAVPLAVPAGAVLDREAVKAGRFEAWCRPEALRGRAARCRLYAGLRRGGLGMKHKPALRSGNFAAWREDLAAVNGFDEAYEGWGQEDDDMGRRLYAHGVRPRVCLLAARAAHIPHPVRRREAWSEGDNTARYGAGVERVRCAKGLDGRPYADVTVTRLGRGAAGAGVPGDSASC